MITEDEARTIALRFANELFEDSEHDMDVELAEDWVFGWFFFYKVAGLEYPLNAIMGGWPLFVDKETGNCIHLTGKMIEQYKKQFSDDN